MKRECSHVDEVMKGVRSGKISKQLDLHAQNCSECRDTLMVAGWMQRFSSFNAVSEENIIPAELVWRRSLRLTRREAVQRALKPLLIPRLAAWIIAVIAPIILVWTYRSDIQNWLEGGRVDMGPVLGVFQTFLGQLFTIFKPLMIPCMVLLMLLLAAGIIRRFFRQPA